MIFDFTHNLFVILTASSPFWLKTTPTFAPERIRLVLFDTPCMFLVDKPVVALARSGYNNHPLDSMDNSGTTSDEADGLIYSKDRNGLLSHIVY